MTIGMYCLSFIGCLGVVFHVKRLVGAEGGSSSFSVGVVVLYLSKLPYGKSDSQVGLLMVMAPVFHVEYWFSGV